jgi:hypothetical protein
LTPTGARVARWLERWVPVERYDGPVHTLPEGDATFYGARGFLLCYGEELVLTALADLFVDYDPETVEWTLPRGARWRVRCWRPEIYHPARYLNFYVKQLRGLADG